MTEERRLFPERILKKPARRVIGLMSGTSMDGMDAALVEIEGFGPSTSVRLLSFTTQPYPPELRDRLERASRSGGGSTEEICRLNVEVAEVEARAAAEAARAAGIAMENVDLIGSHGQTLCHLPERGLHSSLQVGEGAVIAERTGVATVSNFRARDLAAGGQGAPLVPYVDWLLFRSAEESRVMLNVGGIANVTMLPKGLGVEAVLAFDTGPGNMVIDLVARAVSGGDVRMDRGGEGAARGTVVEDLLDELLRHPYFGRRPPKSTGRETFGEGFVGNVLARGAELGATAEDLLATVTELAACTVVQSVVVTVADPSALGKLIVSGGGVHNRTLMQRLGELMRPVPVVPLEDVGFSSDAKEAIAFAVLANETVHGIAANVPAATGARRAVVLGQLVPGTPL